MTYVILTNAWLVQAVYHDQYRLRFIEQQDAYGEYGVYTKNS